MNRNQTPNTFSFNFINSFFAILLLIMAIKIVTFLVILLSLSGLLEASENCKSLDHNVDKGDYDKILKEVYKRTGRLFDDKDVRYMTYEKSNGDIEYCCDLRQISKGVKTECIVSWKKSGHSSSASCSSSTIHWLGLKSSDESRQDLGNSIWISLQNLIILFVCAFYLFKN